MEKYPQPLWKKALLFCPEVRLGDMELISAPIDFVGINNYSRDFASWDWKVPIIHADIGGRNLVEGREIEGDYEINGVRYTSMGWEVYPEGLHEVLTIMKDEYGNPPIYITENGAAFEDTLTKARVHDEHRVNFLKGYLNQVSIAIREGADIRGYFVWSLIDNFEWAEVTVLNILREKGGFQRVRNCKSVKISPFLTLKFIHKGF